MQTNALLMVMAAAILHTGWNFIVKSTRHKHVFMWLAIVVGSVIYSPFLFIHWPIPVDIWPLAILSALAEAAYFFILVYGYSWSDFSLVYPLGRGTGPAFLALWAILFLDERLQFTGILGIIILVFGLIVVGCGEYFSGRLMTSVSRKGIMAALGLAFCISVYSAIDGYAVRIMDPKAYTVLVLGLTGLILMPVITMKFGVPSVLSELKKEAYGIVIVGIAMMLTYILVLQAFNAWRVSYVGALREFSVVLAALAGWRWLGEQFGAMRTTGAVLICCGILLIALTG